MVLYFCNKMKFKKTTKKDISTAKYKAHFEKEIPNKNINLQCPAFARSN